MRTPRRRKSIKSILFDLQNAIADLDERVEELELQSFEDFEEDDWPQLSTAAFEEAAKRNLARAHAATGSVGVGTSGPVLTKAAKAFIQAEFEANQGINTSMSEGNVGIGSTAPAGNIGVGTSTDTPTEVDNAPGGTGVNVGVGSSTDDNVGVGT